MEMLVLIFLTEYIMEDLHDFNNKGFSLNG